MNKKGKAEEAGKKRTKRAAKVQKAIVGMSLDDIKKKKAQRPELRAAAKEAALKEHKERAKTKSAAPKAQAKGGKKALDSKKQGGGAQKKAAVNPKGKKQVARQVRTEVVLTRRAVFGLSQV